MNFVEMALHWCCTSVHFSIQPTCTPTRDVWHRVCGRLVGRSVWYQIAHAIQVRRFIHLGNTFQAVGSYMRHSSNDLWLSGHSWRRPVTA